MTEQLPASIGRTEVIGAARMPIVPTLIAAAGDRASLRFLEFFAANIRNPHTRRAYGRAVAEFMTWCDDNHVPSIAAVPENAISYDGQIDLIGDPRRIAEGICAACRSQNS